MICNITIYHIYIFSSERRYWWSHRGGR